MRTVLDALPAEFHQNPTAIQLRVAQALAAVFTGKDGDIALCSIIQYTRYYDTTLPGTPMETQKQIEGRREVGQFILDALVLVGSEPVGAISAVRRAPPVEEN